jgi:hypothetical protein
MNALRTRRGGDRIPQRLSETTAIRQTGKRVLERKIAGELFGRDAPSAFPLLFPQPSPSKNEQTEGQCIPNQRHFIRFDHTFDGNGSGRDKYIDLVHRERNHQHRRDNEEKILDRSSVSNNETSYAASSALVKHSLSYA